MNEVEDSLKGALNEMNGFTIRCAASPSEWSEGAAQEHEEER